MTTPTSPRLKSTPTAGREAAQQPNHNTSGGMNRDGRQAVLSALPTAQQPPRPATGETRSPVAWLTVRMPAKHATPTAASWCACGREARAAGHAKVLALIEDHTAHRDLCPLRTNTEGRAAA